MDTSYIERDCTIELQERKFEAGGAVVTDDILIAYPAANGILADWHGAVIGRWNILSYWPVRSCYGSTMYSIEAFVNDIRYVGRGFGVNMILKAKRSPRQ